MLGPRLFFVDRGVYRRFLLLVPLVFVSLFFFYPLVSILWLSFSGETWFLLGPFWALLGDSYYLGRIWFTIWQAMVSTVISIALGMPVAYLFSRYEFRGKMFLRALTTLPFVMPTIVVAMGFVALIGPQGVVNSIAMDFFNLTDPPVKFSNTLAIIFMAHAFYNYAIVVRIVSGMWGNLDTHLGDTARVLGAGRIRTFRHVTFPLLIPAIFSSGLMAFAFSFTSFGVVLILGGPQFATLEVSIYELTAKIFDLPLAGALSVVQLIFTFAFFFLYAKLQVSNGVRIDFKPRETTFRKRWRLSDKCFLVFMMLYLLIVLSPLFALVVRMILSVDSYMSVDVLNLFSSARGSYFYLSPIAIIGNSLKFALLTVAISLVVGTIVAYYLSRSRRISGSISDAVFMFPLGVSAVTLGFGYLITFNRWPLDLRGTWIIVVVAHSLVAYPFVVRSLLPVLRGVNPRLREASMVLGASSVRTFISVDIPIIMPALLVGATFAFAVSMGEFGASLLLVRPEFMTIPVAIFRFLGLPGGMNFENALLMSCILMAVVSLGFMSIERFRYRGLGTF